MKTIKINIYTLSDFTKWFWDKFCFPRRKVVAEWLHYHNQMCMDCFDEVVSNALNVDFSSVKDTEEYLKHYDTMRKKVEKQTEKTLKLIMMK